MKIAVLLGAGASHGSQPLSPPLGKDLFSEIKNIVQDHRIKIIKNGEMQAFGSYNLDEVEVHDGTDLGTWIREAHPQAADAFEDDSEKGMALLSELKPSPFFWGAATLTGGPEIKVITPFMDWTLSERVMTTVASHLFSYSPIEESLYFDLLQALPEKSSIFTLNYDTLIEETAAALRYNLKEPDVVHTTHLTRPQKNLFYYQLHGGCTLFEGLSPPTPSMGTGFVTNTDKIYRLRKSSILLDRDPNGGSHSIRMLLDKSEYDTIFARRAQLSFFRADKFSPLGGPYPKSCFKDFGDFLNSKEYVVIICGCRFNNVDKHIWDPVTNAKAKILWCGDVSAMSSLPIGSQFVESKFTKRTIQEIERYAKILK